MKKRRKRPVGAIQLELWRLERKLSQQATAQLLGCHQSAISLIESGRRIPRPGLQLAIERAVEKEPSHNCFRIPRSSWS